MLLLHTLALFLITFFISSSQAKINLNVYRNNNCTGPVHNEVYDQDVEPGGEIAWFREGRGVRSFTVEWEKGTYDGAWAYGAGVDQFINGENTGDCVVYYPMSPSDTLECYQLKTKPEIKTKCTIEEIHMRRHAPDGIPW